MSLATLPALPDKFHRAALAYPDQVREALPTIKTLAGKMDLLAKSEALKDYGRKIKANTASVNAIGRAILYIKADVGEAMPPAPAAERGAKGGRGKKASKPPLLALPVSKPTLSAFRKLAAHADKIEEYAAKIDAANAAEPEDSLEAMEISAGAFLRYVGSDGALCTKHNNGQPAIEWYTPENYVEAARLVMGGIDLDPASNPKAQKIVKAATYWTAKDDGLRKDWGGSVFLNPPYKMPEIKSFVDKLCDSFESSVVHQAILLTNDNTDTSWWQRAAALSSCLCFHAGRISFYNAAGNWSAPTNGQTFFYFGRNTTAFHKAFSEYGLCLLK